MYVPRQELSACLEDVSIPVHDKVFEAACGWSLDRSLSCKIFYTLYKNLSFHCKVNGSNYSSLTLKNISKTKNYPFCNGRSLHCESVVNAWSLYLVPSPPVPGSSGNLYNCQRHNNSLAVYGRNSSTSIATSAVGIAMLFFTVAYMWWVDPTPFPSPLLFPLLSALPSLCFFPSPSFTARFHPCLLQLQSLRTSSDTQAAGQEGNGRR